MAGRERSVGLAGGPVHVVDHGGEGPHTFVCVHGLGGSALDWDLLAPLLARRGRVLAFDLPGFGDTPLAGRAATLAAHQRVLDDLIAREVGGPVTLVANSMGGVVALLQAARAPRAVERLILVSPALPMSLRRRAHPLVTAQFVLYALPGVGEWFVRARRERVDPRVLVDRTVAFMMVDVAEVPRAVFEQRYALVQRRAAHPDNDRAFLASARSLLALLADPVGYRRVLRRVAAPTLVVHGAADRLVSAASAHHLARVRPDWSINVLPDTGHVAQLEAPGTVAGLIERWLSASSPVRGVGGERS